MSTEEERDDSIYKALPLGLRILLRTTIVLFKMSLPWLKKHGLTGYLAIDSISEYEFEEDDDDEEIFH